MATDDTVQRVLDLDAAIFDLDGVLTQTATLHARAWKNLFDGFFSRLEAEGMARGRDLRPFDMEGDYLAYVDGKPRYDGVRDMLQARGIELPWGDTQDAPDDDPQRATICSLGNRKNKKFNDLLERQGADVFPDGLALAQAMHRAGKGVAVVSSSKNCRPILRSAGILELFHSVVDGTDAAKRHLKGKPNPDIFLTAAREMDVAPERAAILEDAISGVQAGKAGGFAEVVGVNRQDETHGRNLLQEGASMVLRDLSPPASESAHKT